MAFGFGNGKQAVWGWGERWQQCAITLPCEDMPLSCGPNRAVTVSSTTILNRCFGDSGLLLASSRASMVRLAVEVSNVDAMLSRVSSSLCDG